MKYVCVSDWSIDLIVPELKIPSMQFVSCVWFSLFTCPYISLIYNVIDVNCFSKQYHIYLWTILMSIISSYYLHPSSIISSPYLHPSWRCVNFHLVNRIELPNFWAYVYVRKYTTCIYLIPCYPILSACFPLCLILCSWKLALETEHKIKYIFYRNCGTLNSIVEMNTKQHRNK